MTLLPLPRRSALGLGLAALSAPLPLRAQSAPLRLVLGFGPGGAVDAVARILAPELSPLLGRPVVIDYVNGANGSRAVNVAAAARSATDTLLFATSSVANRGDPAMAQSRIAEMRPLLVVGRGPMEICARPALPLDDIRALPALLIAQPERSYGSSGVGNVTHFAMLDLLGGLDRRALHVPFPGAAQVLTNLAGGHVDLAVVGAGVAADAPPGVRRLASTAASAADLIGLSDLPTVAGTILPGYAWYVWQALFAPPGAPEAFATEIAEAVNQALALPAVREAMLRVHIVPAGGDARDAERLVAEESARFARLAPHAG